jgi:subtilisin family serine protease
MIDALYARQWHLHGQGAHEDVDPRASLRCNEAWSLAGQGSSEVVVAVVDDGCQVDHPVFGGTEKFVGRAYFDGTEIRFEDHVLAGPPTVNRTHGTSVCALIAGTGTLGTSGVAPKCLLLPIQIRVENSRASISEDDFLRILDIISTHSDIALLSWSRIPSLLLSREVLNKFIKVCSEGGRRRAGVVFICPAGNSNCPISFESAAPLPFSLRADREHPQGYTTMTSRIFRNMLTTIPNVLHVSAISSLARRTFYSCYGPGIDVCAPSSNSRVFTQEVLEGTGRGLTTSYGRNGEVTDNFKGTSGAAALVAGVAALTLSANMRLSAAQLRHVLLQSSSKELDLRDVHSDLPAPYPWEISPVAPYHIGSFDKNGWSPWFGFGKVDARQAVVDALRMAS